MPDGDRIDVNLAPRYHKVYKQLCEEHFSEEDLGQEVLLPVKEELQKQGHQIIPLIDNFAARCDQIVEELENGNEINWDKEALLIEKLAQQIYATKTAKDLAMEACKVLLQNIRYGAHDLNFPIELMRTYMWKLYEAKFQARVLLTKDYYNGAAESYVRERLEGMREYVWNNLIVYAKQAIYHKNFDSLRRPPRHGQKFDLNHLDDVLG